MNYEKFLECTFALTLAISKKDKASLADAYVYAANLNECMLEDITNEFIDLYSCYLNKRPISFVQKSIFLKLCNDYFNKDKNSGKNNFFKLIDESIKIDSAHFNKIVFEFKIPVSDKIQFINSILGDNKNGTKKNPIPILSKSCLDSSEINKTLIVSINNEFQIEIPQSVLENNEIIETNLKSYKGNAPTINIDMVLDTAKKLDISLLRKNNRFDVINNLLNTMNQLPKILTLQTGKKNLFLAPPGRGKTVLIESIILSSAKSIPIVIILDSIPQVIDMYNKIAESISYLKISLRIGTYISPKNRFEYLANVILANNGNIFADEVVKAGRILGYSCKIQKYNNNSSFYEEDFCYNFVYNKKRYLCPYILSCQKFKMYLELNEKNIIITTKQAFLKSKFPFPVKIDGKLSNNISFFTWILNYAGLIIIDEIDTMLSMIASDSSFEISNEEINELSKEIINQIINQRFQTLRIPNLAEMEAIVDELKNSLNITEEWLNNNYIKWVKDFSTINHELLFSMCDTLLASILDNETNLNDILRKKNQDYKNLSSILEKIKKINPGSEFGASVQKKIRHAMEELCISKNKNLNDKTKSKIADFTEKISLYLRLDLILEKYLRFYEIIEDIKELNFTTDINLKQYEHDYEKLYPFGILSKEKIMFKYSKLNEEQHSYVKINLLCYRGNPKRLMTDFGNDFSQYLASHKTSILGLSATCYFPPSSKYHIIGDILGLSEDNSNPDNIILYQKSYEDSNGKPIFISGSNPEQKQERLIELVNLIADDLSNHLSLIEEEDPERNRILLVTNSYEESKTVAKTLRTTELKDNFLVVLKEEDLDDLYDVWLPKNRIEKFYKEYMQKILIAPLSIIARGYNILNNNQVSAISSIWVLVRPLPNIESADTALLYINKNTVDEYWNNSMNSPGDIYEQKYKEVIKREKDYLNSLVPFSHIQTSEIQQDIISTMFLDIIQLIGRARRTNPLDNQGIKMKLTLIDGIFENNKTWKDVLHALFQELKNSPNWKYIFSLYKPILKAFANKYDINMEDVQ